MAESISFYFTRTKVGRVVFHQCLMRVARDEGRQMKGMMEPKMMKH